MSLQREKGASAVLVAASLLLLLGMAAVAVDLGAGFNERRQNQTAADLAALGGALEMVDSDSVIATIIEVTDDNLVASVSDADWQACSDPDRPGGYSPLVRSDSTVYNCISSNGIELRVRIPDQSTDTTFGRLMGVDSIATRAVAHARFEFDAGDVLPFGVLSGAPIGAEICASAAPNPAPPCDGPDSGNFGVVFSPFWGNRSKGTNPRCTGTPSDFLSTNIAIGLDHVVLPAAADTNADGTKTVPEYPGTGGAHPGNSAALPQSVVKYDSCTLSSGTPEPTDPSPEAPINSLPTDTGFPRNDLFLGLIGGNTNPSYPNGVKARLTYVGLQSVVLQERVGGTVYSYTLDNTPLHQYMLSNAAMVANGINDATRTECDRVGSKSAVWGTNPRAQLLVCLQTYVSQGQTGTLFMDSIVDQNRLGYAPQFHYNDWPAGSQYQPVKGYVPIYLDRLWFNCNGSDSTPLSSSDTCSGSAPTSLMWTPGNVGPLSSGSGGSMKSLRLDQLSAITIPFNALPTEVKDEFPGSLKGPFAIELIR
jgi:hypothetical protein